MSVDLRIAESDWQNLRRNLASSFRGGVAAETGALAVLAECQTPAKHEFVVTKVLLPEPGDLKIATSGEVVFDATFIRRAHLAMRKTGLAGIAAFHTHPFADDSVSFSGYDDHQEPRLAENLLELEPRTRLVSIVVGRESQCGRFYAAPRAPEALGRLITVGDQLSVLRLDGQPPPEPPSPEEIFDRALALTGSGALSQLSTMTIVVVGASGTGSLVCELLARAGCKHILLIDHDIVRFINLNRIFYATAADARCGVPKVQVLKRGIEGAGLGCHVEPIRGSILDAKVLRRVLDCDLVFGCVDRALPRYLLCELSYRYLLPYIDIGSEIGGDLDGIVSLDSRVSYIAPGRYCLTCSGIVTPRQLRFESLTESERRREIALGYSDDLVIKQPAVMDLNMRAASNGVLLLRHLIQPFLREPYPVTLSENAITYRTIPVSVARSANLRCPTCQVNSRFGYADCGPQLGFDTEIVRKLSDADVIFETDSSHTKHRLRIPNCLRRASAKLLGRFRADN